MNDSTYLMVDGHQDLAYNMLTFSRDYTLSAAETRRREQGSEVPHINGDTLLGWPEYQRGRVAVIFATLFAAPLRKKEGAWDILCYADTAQARRLYRGQLDTYARLVDEHSDKFQRVEDRSTLDDVLDAWAAQVPAIADEDIEEEQTGERSALEGPPVGLVLLMEGAEAVGDPGELEDWWGYGVRIIGPAWAGTRFCGGTHEPGPLTRDGYALLEGMASLGFALDISHMDEPAALQALDAYGGTLVASHSNARALLKGVDSNRNLTDHVIHGLLERDGVIGVVPANGFLRPGWLQGGGRATVTLQDVVVQIDYICQMAGDAHHVGLGSDYDGGFGLQSVPAEIDTIADLQKLAPLLHQRGYSTDDVAAILGENWLRMLSAILPEGS